MFEKVAVVGSGYMGGGIAQILALAGSDVWLSDASPEATVSSLKRLLAEGEDFEQKELFPAGSAAILRQKLHAAASIEEAVRDADFIEESVPEVLDIKHSVLARIAKASRPDAILGSNTSTIPIGKLAKALPDSGRFLGVHFSNPAPFVPGVELIPHEGTDLSILPHVEMLMADCGKQTARVKDAAGFVLNRLQFALFKEAANIVEDGIASAEDVDTIVRTTFGYRLPFFGPFTIADMSGLDVYAGCFKTLREHFGEKFETPTMLADLVSQGKFGTKTGSGFLKIGPEKTAALVSYRNNAYSKMAKLLKEIGPAPLD